MSLLHACCVSMQNMTSAITVSEKYCSSIWSILAASNLGKLKSSTAINQPMSQGAEHTVRNLTRSSAELLMVNMLSQMLSLLSEITIKTWFCCLSIATEYLKRRCLFFLVFFLQGKFVFNPLNCIKEHQRNGIITSSGRGLLLAGLLHKLCQTGLPQLVLSVHFARETSVQICCWP